MRASNKQPKQSEQSRRHFTPEQKAQILHRHLVDKVSVSQLCDELKLQPSVFYYWQTQLFERAALALSVPKPAASREHQLQEKIVALEAKLQKKDSVIAEISAEYVQLKKELGEL
jgi:transposase-like protein